MSEYQRLYPSINEPSNLSANPVGVESFELEKEAQLLPNVRRFKRWCFALLILAIPYPIAAWFVDEHHIVFYQSWLFFTLQILLALWGLRTLKQDVYKRLEFYTKMIHIYFILFIVALALNQSFFTYTIVKHNKDNCSDFDFYQVCDDRWGLMGAQLTLIIFYPLMIFSAFLIYRHFLQTTKELMMALLRREI